MRGEEHDPIYSIFDLPLRECAPSATGGRRVGVQLPILADGCTAPCCHPPQQSLSGGGRSSSAGSGGIVTPPLIDRYFTSVTMDPPTTPSFTAYGQTSSSSSQTQQQQPSRNYSSRPPTLHPTAIICHSPIRGSSVQSRSMICDDSPYCQQLPPSIIYHQHRQQQQAIFAECYEPPPNYCPMYDGGCSCWQSSPPPPQLIALRRQYSLMHFLMPLFILLPLPF